MKSLNKKTKVALITGGARRIGACIAKTLHSQNINIVLHYRHSAAEAESLAAELNKQRGHSAITCAADLSNIAHLSDLVDTTIKVWGQLDILVNNASSFYPTPYPLVTESAWDELHDSNVKGAFFLAQTAFPHLKKQEGCLINITDIHVEDPFRAYSAYLIAKAGLAMMTKVLAKEMAPEVRVNAVAPGSIMWPESENELTPEQKQKIIDKTLLKKHGQPQDIADAVYFLSQARYITGQTLKVDGGASLS